MILTLALKNFGLFNEATIDFHEGLNIITGESGAGKSMFISAIDSITSGTIPQEFKTKEGSISAYFILNEETKKLLSQYVPVENDELVLSCQFSTRRTLYRINNTIVTKSIIEEIGKYLIELNSQDSSVLLREPVYQNKMIFGILRNKFPEKFIEYDKLYKDYLDLKKKYESIPEDPSEIYRNIDLLQYQIEEIRKVDPQPGEDTELTERFKALNHVEEIKQNIYECLSMLRDNDEGNVDNYLGNVVHNISKINGYGFKEEYDAALAIQEQFSELIDNLESKLNNLEVDPEELEKVSDRLNLIIGLKRKYGPTLEDVIEKVEEMEGKLQTLNDLLDVMNELEPKIKEIKSKLMAESVKIREGSMGYLREIKNNIEKNLKDLNMIYGEMDFYFEEQKEPNENSCYKVRILIKTNPQSDFLPLDKVASGGEMSRIFLAMETVLGTDHYVDTMLFDEVDSGVGPRMSQTIGNKLKELSGAKQLIVITHMPQVANMADKHLKIKKEEINGSLISRIDTITGEERENEVREMYGEIVINTDN